MKIFILSLLVSVERQQNIVVENWFWNQTHLGSNPPDYLQLSNVSEFRYLICKIRMIILVIAHCFVVRIK